MLSKSETIDHGRLTLIRIYERGEEQIEIMLFE